MLLENVLATSRLKFASKRVRTPTLLQMEAVECGAASLGIILGYYRRFVPLTELRQACGVSRDGSKASSVLKAARHYGLAAKGFTLDIEALRAIKPPYIIFWNFNHFLVVEGLDRHYVSLNDPAIGRRRVTLEDFDQSFTGVTLVFEPEPDFKIGGYRPSVWIALLTRLKHSKGVIAFCLMIGFLFTLTRTGAATFSQIFIDDIVLKGQQDWLKPLLLAMGVTALIQSILSWLQSSYLSSLSTKLSTTFSGQFLWHILRLPSNFYAQRYAGEVSSRADLNASVAETLSGPLATTIIDGVMIFLYALLMFAYDGLLTVMAITFAVTNFAALAYLSSARIDTYMQLSQENGKSTGVAISSIQSIETIKASGLENDAFTKFVGTYTKSNNAAQQMALQNQLLSTLPVILTGIASTTIIIAGGFRVMQGEMSLGMLLAYQSLAQNFLSPVNRLVNFGGTLQTLQADLIRLDDILQNSVDPETEREEDVDSSKGKIAVDPVYRLDGYLQFNNVTFGYDALTAPLIENFNLSLNPGERVALIGGSGSGKSTVAKLICGLHSPMQGEILLDGQRRDRIPRLLLANSIAMVEQDIFLFAGTVRDNLTLWDSTISDRDLIAACKDAEIHDVIQGLPNGYQSKLIEGGANLSGGQRQRLEIARALVLNPSILVLDEATSALDAESEFTIEQNLRRRGCTCVVVAHRLSSIRDCDEIIVMHQGKVEQRGTYDELRQQHGLFNHLIQSEAGG
jgi:ATP-binding cassette, subfamily C, bacterial